MPHFDTPSLDTVASKDGGTVVVQSRWTLFRDDAGRPQSLLVVSSDALNLQLNEAQFLRAQQAASLATLSDVLARELRATIEPLLLASQLLRVRTQTDSPHWPDGPDAQPSAMSDLMRQVEALARPARAQRVELAVSAILEEVGRHFRQAITPGIPITTSAPEDLWAVAGDPDALRQALLNLCVNAREAMPNGGLLQVFAENLLLKEFDQRLRSGGRPGPHVVITVTDNGSGIAPENLAHIFKPFFTTKAQGQSVGVGLTAVQAVARSHAGFVTVDSEVGRGSRFRIYLSATSSTTSPEKVQPRRSFPRGNGECILLVDDELGFREITQVTLEKYGYRVLTANDGSEGMTLFMRHRQEIQLVLTDIVMPVMDGAALIRSLHKMGAPMRYLAVSGLVEREKIIVATAAPDVHVEFLAKPFTTEKLLTLVRELLARPIAISG